jgi:O-antigen ligase
VRSPYLSIATNSLDNSYLKVAYEQGVPGLVLFAGALVLILVRLCWSAVRSRDPESAALGIGAAGALGSMIVVLYTGMYLETVLVLGPWIAIGVGAGILIRRESAALPARGPAPHSA